jgi:hypothetical protein
MGVGGIQQRATAELLHDIADLEAQSRRAYGASLELIAELVSRDAAAEVGYPTTAVLLRDVLRINTRDATRRLSHAAAVTETPVISGGVVAAALPVTAAVIRDGVLGAEHVEVIAAALRGLPLNVSEADLGFAERTLVDAARELDPGRLARVGHRVREWLHEDAAPPDPRELADPVNELHLSTKPNGRTAFRGELDRESSALLLAVLSPLARPRPGGDDPDPRSAAERHGDALVEVLHLVADTGALSTEGGERPHLTVTVSLAVLRAELGDALLDGAGSIDAASARRLACDARIVPAVLGSRSEPLDLGRASYTVGAALRRALVLRDRGCAFPGCDRSYRSCHAHHCRHWIDGGSTELDNLVLLCGGHHRMIHHSDWDCTITHGRPEFRPPEFLDPTRAPRRNTIHAHPRRH